MRQAPLSDHLTTPSGDPADQVLARHVHPPGWQNPRAADRYDLIVLGGGTAGLVSAMGAAGLGARVALVERQFLGGDCLNSGCVPSKAIIRSARVVGELRRAVALGVHAGDVSVDFPEVMHRMRERRASIAEHDAAERLKRAGVDVFFGNGRFADARTVLVDDQRLQFGRAVIATGSRPTVPAVPGLEVAPFLTNETVFSLTELPRRLLVIGAGPMGCELAQAFARFGTVVTLFGRARQPLPREDADAAAILQRHLEADSIRLELGVTLDRVDQSGREVSVHYRHDGAAEASARDSIGDVVLVAAGRTPSIDGLALDAAGIAVNDDGVVVNDRLQTSNRRVYASGDVCSRFKFTHAADAMSRIVLQNALFHGRRKASALVIPWVTYTDPEVAHVGVTAADVSRSEGRLRTITIPLSEVDRAVVEDESDGFVRVLHERGVVRGCTIVARHAGEMIGEVVFAMTHGGTLSKLSGTVHPYPTQAEALRKAGDAYRREALTPNIRRWLERYFRWTR
jgi:pyruvate/2-oxoglutarate dehydrogenase complex dihydrolipoamide dehydrogenase (E3) component